MDQIVNVNILKQHVKPSLQKLDTDDDDFYFQQDNDSKHTARIVKNWLLYNTRHMLKTPPQSPNLKSIEHLWTELKQKLRKKADYKYRR